MRSEPAGQQVDHPTAPPTPRRIRLGSSGLIVDEHEEPLLSGAMHYWRLDPASWDPILDRMKALGFRMVETYLPWSVHWERDHYELGQSDPRRDVAGFLRRVQSKGMKAIVRPGPHINSELTDFGFPPHILTNPAMQARTGHGTVAWFPGFPRPFPIPSYASDAFFEAVQGWFDAILPVVKDALHPAGPVVAVQVDNELSQFFRTSLYDLDYHPDALRDFRRFLEARYGSLEALNRAWRSTWTRFDAIEAPRRFVAQEPVARHLDWGRFQTEMLLSAFTRIQEGLRRHLPADLLYFTNLPLPAMTFPFDLGRIEAQLDQVGLDFYFTRQELTKVQEGARILHGQTRLPCSPEFGSGGFLTWTPTTPDDNIQATLTAVMYGVRAFNFYMLVERERWYGSPIRPDGTVREPLGHFYTRLNALFRQHQLWQPRRQVQVAVLRSQALDRLMHAAFLLNPASTLVVRGLKRKFSVFCREDGPCQVLSPYEDWLLDAQDQLQRRSLDFDLGEVEQNPDLLRRYDLLLTPTFHRWDRLAWTRLRAQLEAGALALTGPELPSVSLEDGLPLPHDGLSLETSESGLQRYRLGAGTLVVAEQLEHGLQDCLERCALTTTGVTCLEATSTGKARAIHAVRMPARGPLPALVWILNSGPEPALVRIEHAPHLVDLFSDAHLQGDPAIGTSLLMEGHTVRAFQIASAH